MFYLIIGFLCSASISLIFKFAGKTEYNRYAMLLFNYLTCVVAGFLSLPEKTISLSNAGSRLTLALGALNGCLYLAGMAMNQINVRRNGAILQSTFTRLGVMVPVLFSILFFGERPSLPQTIGILLVALAMLFLNRGDRQETRPSFLLLFLCLFFGGLADFMSKIFQQVGTRDMDGWFIVLTFFFAFLISAILVVTTKARFGWKEVLLGIGIGIPNLLSSRFLLEALSSVKAYMAYPIYSVGAILVVTLVSLVFFKERLSKWSGVSFIFIIASLILLNI